MNKIYLATALVLLSTSAFSQELMPQTIDNDQYVFCQLEVLENAPEQVHHVFDLASWNFSKGQSENFKVFAGYSGQLLEGDIHFAKKGDQNILIKPKINLMDKNLSVSKFREIYSSSSVINFSEINPFYSATDVVGVEAISYVAIECRLQTYMEHVMTLLSESSSAPAVLQEQLEKQELELIDAGDRGRLLKESNGGATAPKSSQGDFSLEF